MNKKIDFTGTGGLPMTQYTLDYMQSSYRDALASIAALGGNKVIVSGCDVGYGNVVSKGWISYNGELVPFTGGTLSGVGPIAIVETSQPRTYADGSTHPVYFEKVAQFGSPGNFNFTELKKFPVVPTGLISMWSGMVNNIPSGWVLCDGRPGTPDLRGRFIVGYDPNDADYGYIGKTDGYKRVSLSINQIPKHTHTMYFSYGELNHSHGSDDWKASTGTDRSRETGPAGGNASGSADAHENRPPYYTLAYIMKL